MFHSKPFNQSNNWIQSVWFGLIILFGISTKPTNYRPVKIKLSKKTHQSTNANQSTFEIQSIGMILLVIQSSFVSNSNATSCGPNSDCSIFLQTCSSDLCICAVGNNWQNPTQMQTIRRAQASVADNIGNVFVFGGYVSLFGLTNTAEKYLTSSNSWSYINPLPKSLANINGVFINDKIFIHWWYQ